MPADIILYALVAAGLVFWLRSLLGTRNEGERQRPNPYTEAERLRAQNASAPGAAKAGVGLLEDGTVDLSAGLGRNMAIAEDAKAGLMEIARNDRGFSVAHFLTGAQDAFVMIVEAFARGDWESLKNLLHDPVYHSFDQAISEREQRGEEAMVEIHAVRRAEIVKAWIADRTAFITVRFVADETNLLRDRDGQYLSGHPDRVTETVDIWTFGRDIRARTPEWFLYETRDADAAMSDVKTVPDSI